MTPLEPAQLEKSDGLNLPRPFDQDDRRIIAQEVDKVMNKRAQTGKKLLEATVRLTELDGSDAQQQQQKLLQISQRMKAREQKFKRRQNNILYEREELYKLDPSNLRADDVNLMKAMVAKLNCQTKTSAPEKKSNAHRNVDNEAFHPASNPENSFSGNDSYCTFQDDMDDQTSLNTVDIVF
ncbi:uncharacterized protein CTRU02_208698 [Colletotrichum truncatum]|uniref:Uncharacterized protein n=1 Tax=Colletotrichum truncatum TaxID=5467 RepID=A0ACC3YX13_COLTU|nr:uncharacterized protein CTRU02_06643 [Colletotrichum truncatum]KAF6792560.1 hypothetical protein CTRU02_06643 [Colletotrichum truncatum]